MRKRPFAVTVVGWLLMAAATFGLVRGFAGARSWWPPERDLLWIVAIDLTGIVCGVFLLKGRNWARWLTLLWVGGHVLIVSLYMPRMVPAHAVIFAMIGYLLAFRGDVRAYFRGDTAAV